MIGKLVRLVILQVVASCWIQNATSYPNPDQEVFQREMMALEQPGLNLWEIDKWWRWTQRQRQPRLFPLCVAKDASGNWPEKLKNISEILNDILAKDEWMFDPSIHSWIPYRFNLKSISVFRVTVNDTLINKMFPLRFWGNFQFKFEVAMKAVYFQPITSIAGLPSGEFRLDNFCKLKFSEEPRWEYLKHQHTVPCSYAPRWGYHHPNVYYVDGEKGHGRFQFRYQWPEAQCQQTVFIQFLIIASEDYIKYEAFYTPVYRFKQLDSLSGVPTPQHLNLTEVNCGAPYSDPDGNKILENRNVRIIPNIDYDNCILKGTGKVDDTCPPGYLECEEQPQFKDGAEWSKIEENWWEDLMKYENYRDCCDLPPPPPGPAPPPEPLPSTTTPSPTTTTRPTTTTPRPTTTTTKTSYRQREEALRLRAARADREQKINHGDLCIMVWLILIPIADHIARFYKDFPDFEDLGLGFWIIAHGSIHCVALVLLWLSFGLVMGSGDDKVGNISGGHLLMGVVLSIIHHLQFYTAIFRNVRSESDSFRSVLLHSVCSYFGYFISCCSIFLTQTTFSRLILSLALIGMRVVAVIVSELVELKQDKRLEVLVHRAQFPILQRLKIDGWPPLATLKIVVLGVIVVSMMGAFTATLIVSNPLKNFRVV